MQVAAAAPVQATLLPEWPREINGYHYPINPDCLGESAREVLDKLREAGSAGVTHWDFGNGLALRSRISDLRKLGFDIHTKLERNESGKGSHARYRLVKVWE